MTPDDLKENERKLDIIDRLKTADDDGVARILKSMSESECAEIGRHADQIGQRGVGAAVWNHVRKMGVMPHVSANYPPRS